jgi:hypothetical protein
MRSISTLPGSHSEAFLSSSLFPVLISTGCLHVFLWWLRITETGGFVVQAFATSVCETAQQGLALVGGH